MKTAKKIIVTYGDSITWYDGKEYLPETKEPGKTVVGYQSYMREKLDAVVINRGISGYTTPEISRYIQNSDFAGVDAVTILAGTNDFRDMRSEPIGEISTIGSSFVMDTFIGAYQQAIEYILNNYPETKIYLFTPIQAWEDSLGLMPETYPQAVIDLGALYSIPVCDLYHQSGINESTKSVYIVDIDELPFDFHLSTEGYSKIANIIVPFLENN
jgi:lysophospholipase L1-like esterase